MNSLFNRKPITPGRVIRDKRVDIEIEQCKNYVFVLQDMNEQIVKSIKALNKRLNDLEKRMTHANL
jgi:hypothetical protein